MAMTFDEAVKVLNFKSGITFKDAKIQWRRLNMMWHPDRNKSKEAVNKSMSINEAWRIFEARFQNSTSCTWSTEKSSSNTKSTYGKHTYTKSSSYSKANAEYDEYDEDEYDEYEYEYDKYSSSKTNKPKFDYINGNIQTISLSFFKSYFVNMRQAIHDDTYNQKTFVDAISTYFQSYKFTKLGLDYATYYFSTMLACMQNKDIFLKSLAIHTELLDMYNAEFVDIVDPRVIRFRPPHMNINSTFYLVDYLCRSPLSELTLEQKEYAHWRFRNETLENNSFKADCSSIDPKGLFYKKIIANRPDLLSIFIKTGTLDLDNVIYKDKPILTDILTLLTNNSKDTNRYVGDALLAGWKYFKDSLPEQICSLNKTLAIDLLDLIVKTKPDLAPWVIINFDKSYLPNTATFKQACTQYEVSIAAQKDVVRLNQQLAVSLLNEKYNALKSPLARAMAACSSLFGRSKMNNNAANNIEKLANSLGIDKKLLLRQYNSEKDCFENRTELSF